MTMNTQSQAAELVAWLRAALRPRSVSEEPGLRPTALEVPDAIQERGATEVDARQPSGDGRPLGERDAFWAAAGPRQAQAAKEAVLDICAQGCRYQKACRTTKCGLYRIEQAARRSLSEEAGLSL